MRIDNQNTYISVIIGKGSRSLLTIGEVNSPAQSHADRRSLMLSAMNEGGLQPTDVLAAAIMNVAEFQTNPKALYALVGLMACVGAESPTGDVTVALNSAALGLPESASPKQAIDALLARADWPESTAETSEGQTIQ